MSLARTGISLGVLECWGEEGGQNAPVLGDDAVAQRVERLLAPVGHGDLGARRAPLALLELATHCVWCERRVFCVW